MMEGSLHGVGPRVLAVVNGAFSKRWADIARILPRLDGCPLERILGPNPRQPQEAALQVAPPSVEWESLAPQWPWPSAAQSVPEFGSRATKLTPAPACPAKRGRHAPEVFSVMKVPLRVPTKI